MVRCKVLTPGKETIYTRVARKNYRCHECKGLIAKGTSYIEDHINYPALNRKTLVAYKRYYVNKICLVCWKGDVP